MQNEGKDLLERLLDLAAAIIRLIVRFKNTIKQVYFEFCTLQFSFFIVCSKFH